MKVSDKAIEEVRQVRLAQEEEYVRESKETMYSIIKVGVLLEGEHRGWSVINIQQEPWGFHKNEIVRVFENPSRREVARVAERLSELLGLDVYYSDSLTMQEFVERED